MTGSLVHLRLVQPARIDLVRAHPLLGDDALAWLGSPVEDPAAQPGRRRVLTDLTLPLRDDTSRLVLRKAAYVDLGTPEELGERLRCEIAWCSATHAPLFPIFAGFLTVGPTELRLEGYYAPPGGEFGVVLDRALLNVAARATARCLLRTFASTLAAAEPA